MIEFRKYTEKDFPEILNLWISSGMAGKERGDNHKQIQKTIDAGGKLIVMTSEKKIIGTSWLTSDSRRLHLHHFAVLHRYRGKGYSHYLMKESIKFAQSKNMQLKLEVHKENITAINLYKKYGFHTFDDYYIMVIRKPNEIQI